MRTNYNGYLKPHLPLIGMLIEAGNSPREIAEWLLDAGVRSEGTTRYGDYYGQATERQRLQTLVSYIMDRPRREIAGQIKPPRTRPIDMGGRRDHWHVWTPEMQAREFGL